MANHHFKPLLKDRVVNYTDRGGRGVKYLSSEEDLRAIGREDKAVNVEPGDVVLLRESGDDLVPLEDDNYDVRFLVFKGRDALDEARNKKKEIEERFPEEEYEGNRLEVVSDWGAIIQIDKYDWCVQLC